MLRRTWEICFFKFATCFERGSSQQQSTVWWVQENRVDAYLPIDWYSFKRWSNTSRRSSKVRSRSNNNDLRSSDFLLRGNDTHHHHRFPPSADPWLYRIGWPHTLGGLVWVRSSPTLERKNTSSSPSQSSALPYRVVWSLLCRTALKAENSRNPKNLALFSYTSLRWRNDSSSRSAQNRSQTDPNWRIHLDRFVSSWWRNPSDEWWIYNTWAPRKPVVFFVPRDVIFSLPCHPLDWRKNDCRLAFPVARANDEGTRWTVVSDCQVLVGQFWSRETESSFFNAKRHRLTKSRFNFSRFRISSTKSRVRSRSCRRRRHWIICCDNCLSEYSWALLD